MIRWLTAIIFSLLIHASIIFFYNFFQNYDLNIKERKVTGVKFLPAETKQEIKEIQRKSVEPKIAEPKATQPAIVEQKNDFSSYINEELLMELNQENMDLVEEISFKVINDLQNIWIEPKNLPLGVYADFSLEVDRLGNIISFKLIRSSGIGAFDRAAQNAIRKYNKIKYITEIDESLYSTYFEKFTIRFIPK
jgi:colicin import membrane protein